jgi:thymidylate synthase (FAD)
VSTCELLFTNEMYLMKIATIEVAAIHPERWGNDLDVVNAARVSFHKISEEFTEQDAKLITYLAKHKHHSPFNHTFMSFRIKAPIFVARQLVKHKFMPWNEVSRRYVDSEPEFFFPKGWREKSENVKQGSGSRIEGLLSDVVDRSFYEACEFSISAYISMKENGVCPEQARMVLPQNMMTEWIWSGTLGAFLDMLVLRLDTHTQFETQLVAHFIAGYVKQHFPASYAAYINE